MSLNDELKMLRTRAEAKRPPEIVATMRRAVDELRASGAPGRVLKVGDIALQNVLPDITDLGGEPGGHLAAAAAPQP